MYYPPIPTRFKCFGDVEAATHLIPGSRKLLHSLNQDMSFNSLPTGKKKYIYQDGTIIDLYIGYGLSFVNIYVPTFGGRSRGFVEYYDKCFCNVNFAVCHIISRADYSEDTIEGFIGNNVRYDLLVCNKTDVPCQDGHEYVLYENCLLSDFADVVPDDECTGNEDDFIMLGIAMIHGFQDAQMGENPEEPIDFACLVDTTDVTPGDEPRYRVVPLYEHIVYSEALETDVELYKKWDVYQRVCRS